MRFSDTATGIMEGLVVLHNIIFYWLILILFIVIGLLWVIVGDNYELTRSNNKSNSELLEVYTLRGIQYNFTQTVVHSKLLEIIWTTIPGLILIVIAIPSFSLLYSMDEVVEPTISIKLLGHQWYWSYEFNHNLTTILEDKDDFSFKLVDDVEDSSTITSLNVVNSLLSSNEDILADGLFTLKASVLPTVNGSVQDSISGDTYTLETSLLMNDFLPQEFNLSDEFITMSINTYLASELTKLTDCGSETLTLLNECAREILILQIIKFLESNNALSNSDLDVYMSTLKPSPDLLALMLKVDNIIYETSSDLAPKFLNKEATLIVPTATREVSFKESSYNYDSNLVLDNELVPGNLRLLTVDKKLWLPVNTHINLLITSSDVLHSWALPAAGIKLDAIPGRLNQVATLFKREGIFYGQCSEICGVNHAFMPIVVKIVPINLWAYWYSAHAL